MTVASFYLATLGCKVNQYESHALREAWLRLGLREAAKPADAGLIVVNSCAVTAGAVADMRAAVRRLHRAAPEAAILVTGCAAEIMPADIAQLPGVLRVVPQHDKPALLQGLPLPGGKTALNGPLSEKPPYPPFALSGYARSRAVLKVQDGCSHRCGYCVVPLTRGPARSRSFDDSLAEAKRLLTAGFREIVISGVNLRQYRQPGGDFWDLLRGLDKALAPEWKGRARFRVSSLEPGQLGEKALDVLADCRLVAPHLHISLQSGSPTVLSRMGRGHYDPRRLPDFLSALRALWPVYGLGADLLSGFPAESDAEFDEGLALVRDLPLTYAHVFPYSRRPGTAAAAMPGHIAPELKKERAAALRAVAQAKKRAFSESLLATAVMRVVLEDRAGKGRRQGMNEYYVDCALADDPEKRRLPARELLRAKPLSVTDDGLLVRPAHEGGP
ncbi:MAG: MiaB/RimO family radical SAM methylthiotransferase [Desulfovibrio sp.]|jgi:MiaB/RimO family radical SAM methylthiotransferase|nr:MiaB/RimO family radical SAM methylthiotransferase [Desulfovibrio sp.]